MLGHELVRLARGADPHRRLVDASRLPLARLRDRSGESALLAVPYGRPGMEILLQLDPDRHVGVADWVGADVPLHASSAGKLVLAELDDAELAAWLDANPLASFTEKTVTDLETLQGELGRVRRQGWAELVDELENGLTSISVPVLSPRRSLVGIVGVSGPTFRLPRGRRRELVPETQATAAEIERALAP